LTNQEYMHSLTKQVSTIFALAKLKSSLHRFHFVGKKAYGRAIKGKLSVNFDVAYNSKCPIYNESYSAKLVTKSFIKFLEVRGLLLNGKIST